ncbi:surface anchored protein [Streptococcus pneumoniae]|nr:surface anchored protein [Streptococcus pneumoniae]VSU99762.1 surface anchored protein [Streptococcus pneumoniae]
MIKKDDTTGSVTVTVPADKISGNRTITASAKAGTGAGESTQRDFTQTVPEHQAPTISEVTVAAGATPDAAALNAAIIAPKKVKAEATEALKAVAAGTSATIPVTITYQDGSTEPAEVTVYSKQSTPSKVTAVQKDNGDVSLSLPSDGESVSISYRAEGVDKMLKLSKAGGNWSVTEGDRTVLAGDQVVLSYKGLDRTQVISTSATAGSDKYLSEVASQDYTVKEHSVTITTLVKPFEQNVTDKDLLDAVNADHKKSAKLKDGTSYPTTDGFHDIDLTVTYEDGSMENVSVKYKVTDTAKADIDTKAAEKKTAIEKTPNLTPEEINAAKRQVDEALAEAKRKVGEATDQAGINRAKQEGLSSIDLVLDQALVQSFGRTNGRRSRRTPPRRSRRSVGFVGNSQTGTTPSAVDNSELRTLVEDLERRLKELEGLSPEAQSILREAQAALANDSLTAQELAKLLAKVRQALNSIQAGTSADKSPSTSNSNKEAESAKEPTNATDVPLYGVFGAAALSLLGALLFAVARKKNSQLDKLLRELDQLLVELEASDKDKKGLGKAKKLAKKARTFVDSQQKDPQKEAELISEIKTTLSQLREGV